MRWRPALSWIEPGALVHVVEPEAQDRRVEALRRGLVGHAQDDMIELQDFPAAAGGQDLVHVYGACLDRRVGHQLSLTSLEWTGWSRPVLAAPRARCRDGAPGRCAPVRKIVMLTATASRWSRENSIGARSRRSAAWARRRARVGLRQEHVPGIHGPQPRSPRAGAPRPQRSGRAPGGRGRGSGPAPSPGSASPKP